MKEITAYKSEDGKYFEDELECLQHDFILKFNEQLKPGDLFMPSWNIENVEDLACAIEANATYLGSLLAEYPTKLPPKLAKCP